MTNPATHGELTATACRFCGNSVENRVYVAHDQHFGIPGDFHYLECHECKSLQLLDLPEDPGRHYPAEYYSFEENPEPTSPQVIQYRHYPAMGVEKHHSILDLGCGTGSFLLAMQRDGYTNLTGADPMIPRDISYKGGINIYRKSAAELQGEYDLVMMHHAFEHIADQHQALRELRELVKPGHYLFLRMPVADCWAWHEYHTDWVQLDAPRHVNLHTERSMEKLAGECGFELTQVEFDSNNFQFWGSELYRRGVILSESDFKPRRDLSPAQLEEYNARAQALNEERRGDQACFYLRKNISD